MRVYLVLTLLACGIQVASASVGPKWLFATHLGGGGFDEAFSVATDVAGNIYVAGLTSSPSFPGTSAGPSGPDDAFVTKFSPAGQLIYSLRIGGSSFDEAFGIAVDEIGNVYVTGQTGSSDFPIVNGFQTQFGGGFSDAFVVKLDPSGQLVYSSYLGGTGGNEAAQAIAADALGNVYLAGRTDSVNFPTKNAIQANLAGGPDGFVAKVNTTSTGPASLVYSTYLGGNDFDSANAIAVDTVGNVFVAGGTAGLFPTTADAFQSTPASFLNAFATKLDANGGLAYSTYLGGSGSDVARGIATDLLGNVYVTGETSSVDFPTTLQAFQVTNNSTQASRTAFVVKLTPTVAGPGGLLYSSYLGGAGPDSGSGVAVDAAGHLVITGYTASPTFPLLNPIQASIAGGRDAFVVELDPSIAESGALVFGTFLGGANDDESSGIALATDHRVAVAGFTDGAFPSVGSFQLPPGGSRDAFVAFITADADVPSITTPADAVLNATSPAGTVFTFVVTAIDAGDPQVVASCLLPSGSTFPIGTTLNSCSATDASGNTSTASFHVTVKGAADQIADLKAYVVGLNLPAGLTNGLLAKLDTAASLRLPKSCAALDDFISQVSAQTGKAISSQDAATLHASAARIQAVLGCR